ncbi:hypothetical protein JCM8097_000244 [Rhodosporidiobolus ruineniae]
MVTHAPPPSLFTPTTVLSLLSTVALLLAALVLARALLPSSTYANRTHRYTFIWLTFDALIHLTLEASFVYLSFPAPRTVNTGTGPMAALWREYALADTRWGVSDPTVVCIEMITVLGAGPLCVWTAELMRRGDSAWRYWIIVLSVGELYGGWLTFGPEWISGSPSLNTSHWMYTYLYLFFFNFLWVIIPLVLLYNVYVDLLPALRAVEAKSDINKRS